MMMCLANQNVMPINANANDVNIIWTTIRRQGQAKLTFAAAAA
jgi:hypothetical protein